MLDGDKSVHLAVQGKSDDLAWVFRIKFDDPGELLFIDIALDEQIWVSSATSSSVKTQLQEYTPGVTLLILDVSGSAHFSYWIINTNNYLITGSPSDIPCSLESFFFFWN